MKRRKVPSIGYRVSDIEYRISSIKYLVTVFLLDQASKYLVHSYPNAFKSRISSAIALEPSFNAYAPFSWPISNYVLLIGGIITLLVIFFYSPSYQGGSASWRRGGSLPKSHPWGVTLAMAIIVSAGFSNLLDRALFGSVREIARLGSLTFNLADVVIIISILVILVEAINWKKPMQTLPNRP